MHQKPENKVLQGFAIFNKIANFWLIKHQTNDSSLEVKIGMFDHYDYFLA